MGMILKRIQASATGYIVGGTAVADRRGQAVYQFTLAHSGADAKATFYDRDPVDTAAVVLAILMVTDEIHCDRESPGAGQGCKESDYGVYVVLTAAGIVGIDVRGA